MNRKAESIAIGLIVAGLVLCPERVLADETAQSKTANKVEQPEKEKGSADKAQAPVDSGKGQGEKKRFVDRDGDGIQDGMEHRFRRRKGFMHKSKWQGEGRQLKRAGKGHKQNGKPDGR